MVYLHRNETISSVLHRYGSIRAHFYRCEPEEFICTDTSRARLNGSGNRCGCRRANLHSFGTIRAHLHICETMKDYLRRCILKHISSYAAP